MGKRDDFWDHVPADEEGQFVLPEDAAQRVALVRSAFGAKVIGALESVLHDSLEIAGGKPPEPGSTDYQVEAARREVFAKMSEAERVEVRRLLRRSCFGTLYWILVKLEHFPLGNVDFTVEPFTPTGKSFPRVGVEETELHHLYFEWVERFSDYGDR